MQFLLDHDVPDDLSYLLEELGHEVTLLRKAVPRDASDEAVFRFADGAGCILLTCNRDDFSASGSDQATPGHRYYHQAANSRRGACRAVSVAGARQRNWPQK